LYLKASMLPIRLQTLTTGRNVILQNLTPVPFPLPYAGLL
jgi:hypothetical protein